MSPQGRQAHGAVLTRQGMPLRSWGTQLNDTTCRRAHGVGCPAVAEGEGAGASAPIATEGDDTIVAIVSGEIQGAVSILRLSGSQAVEIASEVFQTPGKPGSWEPRSHRVYYGTARDREGNMLDEVHRRPRLLCHVEEASLMHHGWCIQSLALGMAGLHGLW